MKTSTVYLSCLLAIVLLFAIAVPSNSKHLPRSKTLSDALFKHQFIFGAASYGKSFTNEVENPKIYLDHPTKQPNRGKIQSNRAFSPSFYQKNSRLRSRIESELTTTESLIEKAKNDSIPLQIVRAALRSESTVEITFSEPVDPAYAIVSSLYTINGVAPEAVDWGNDASKITLHLRAPLTSTSIDINFTDLPTAKKGIPYSNHQTLKLLRMADIDFKDLVINEVMAAPKKDNPLPYAEYVEIINVSDNPVELGGFYLKDAKKAVKLPPYTIQPEEYLVLVDEDDAADFMGYGKVLPLSSWPGYTNSSGKVLICDENKVVIDSLSYSNDSYGSSSKANEGYSLEVTNPFLSCDQSLFLQASSSPKKGTPGTENAVFNITPDMMGPRLTAVTVQDPTSILAIFNEPLSPSALSAGWILNNNLNVLNVSFAQGSSNEILLTLNQELKEKTAYQIAVKDLYDCTGNTVDREYNSASFQLPSSAAKGELILNELLSNPRSGTPKFVEIYNHSSKYIDLSGWKLANIDDGVIDNRKVIASTPKIIAPFDYLVVTTDIAELNQQYPKGITEKWAEISALPSYPISGGAVILLSPDEELVERLDYTDDMQHPLIQNPKGISLERSSPEHEGNDPENWHSAAASAGYATPGYKNSQHLTLEQSGFGINVQPKVFLPEAAGEQPFTTISYELADAGYLGTLRIFGTDGRLVMTICQNELWGTKGFYTWNGTNTTGRKVRPGYYILLSEIIHPDGQVMHQKQTIVVGSKLR
ncbi:hypothetical protein DN752_09915 [Echinicola strongylocentroti]|uniref:LTD domain-containing protein n=1 Tax=Echinicola strongylocentroti TaxID=1795355 RepID=A0A2Z4IGX8_9BACT|nr:lamin tail domain-containing protein [Echinicola strongylocentroti]AWW30411.1 hypothetical protein DN752_09915 [Echinicola strongylocentroti]